MIFTEVDILLIFQQFFFLILLFIIGFVSTYLFLPYLIKWMRNKQYMGIDIHKVDKPEVPESGGVSLVVGTTITSLAAILFFPTLYAEILIFMLTIITAGFIGYIDDRTKLKSIFKIILTIFTGIFLFLGNYYNFITIESPTFPFIGKTRLTIIYPLMIPIIVSVFTNTVNMLEGYNGEGAGTCMIALVFILICAILWNSWIAILFSVISLAIIIPFYIYNKYPAKIFPGDVGTLSMGAMIACIALFGSLEVVVSCTLLIHIFNSFFVLASLRGFLESGNISEERQDIILLDNGLIEASRRRNAVLTLPRLILAKGPLTEKNLVLNFYIISITCGFFSISSVLLMLYSTTGFPLDVIFYVFITIIILISILVYLFPRIRGVIVLMIGLLATIALVLYYIDIIVAIFPFHYIDLLFLQIPLNIVLSALLFVLTLLLMYFVSILYFRVQVTRMERRENSKNFK